MRAQDLQLRYNEWHQRRLEQRTAAVDVDPPQARFYRWLLGLVDARPGQSLLDVACGQGQFLGYAAAHDLEVTGMDISDLAVEEARRRLPEADVRVGEAESLPFEDESFDLVSCLGSLEHFPDPLGAAAEMRRVLRTGGAAVIFVPNLFFLGHIWFGLRHGMQPTEGEQGFSETFRSSQGWSELLTDAGFTVRDFHPWNHIYASERVGATVKRVWNVVSHAVPRNGAYAFAFVCVR